jgi:hypothetical protein
MRLLYGNGLTEQVGVEAGKLASSKEAGTECRLVMRLLYGNGLTEQVGVEAGKLASSKEAGTECRLVSIEPSLRTTISWHDLLQVVPKLFAVGTMS